MADETTGAGNISALTVPRDWADVIAAAEAAVRAFGDAVRPALEGTRGEKLATSSILILVMVDAEKPVRVSDLIREGRLIASNATYALKALTDAGCISREEDPDDSRRARVVVTKVGRDILDRIRQRCAATPNTVHWLRMSVDLNKNFFGDLDRTGKALGGEAPVKRRRKAAGAGADKSASSPDKAKSAQKPRSKPVTTGAVALEKSKNGASQAPAAAKEREPERAEPAKSSVQPRGRASEKTERAPVQPSVRPDEAHGADQANPSRRRPERPKAAELPFDGPQQASSKPPRQPALDLGLDLFGKPGK